MAQHFILDGYNVIHKILDPLPAKLEDQRRALIRYIETRQPQGSLRNKITVVFDGKAGVFSPNDSAIVEVIFSKDETADDQIKRMVERMKNPKNVVVVSDDRAVCYAVRASGAQVKSVKEFMDLSMGSSNASQPKTKYISKTLENKINSEFEDIWVNKKKEES